MPEQRANQRALAASRIVENLAYALPGYFDELLTRINHTIGFQDHTPGAPPLVDQPTVLLRGECEGTIVADGLHPAWEAHGTVLITCGRERPCPIHDYPVTLTIPEHTAQQREAWRAEHADAQQVITTITLLANELLARARRTVPLITLPVPRCDATGMDGYLQPRPPHGDGWSDLSCNKARSRGTLCDACSQREYRWRKAHGMPPRADGTYSQPKATAS